VAIAPSEQTPVPVGVPKTGYMTITMAKTAAAVISADSTGTTRPAGEDLGVVCLMDMGNTAAIMKAFPVLPPRQSSYMKKAVWAKWLKLGFERYFLWKMKNGLSSLP
jgi:sulfide:quinone oxidoreductase